MSQSTTLQNNIAKLNGRPVLKLLAHGIIITLLLFYIDEGYYNFKWMLNWGNWIAFAIYVGIFFVNQCLAYFIVLAKYKGRYKPTLATITGVALGIGIIFGIYCLVRLL